MPRTGALRAIVLVAVIASSSGCAEGLVDKPDGEPVLIEAIGVDGTRGYVKESDLDGPMPANPAEAATMPTGSRLIPLYAEDGQTVIGQFFVGEGFVEEVPATPSP